MSDNIVEKFNITLDEFICKMINQISDEPKIKTYYSAFKVAKMFKKNLPIELYMGGCINFVEQIKTRDSEFFLQRKQFVTACVECSSFSNDIGLLNHWSNLSDNTKSAIWDYIQTLFVMGEMYMKKNENSLEKITSVYNNFSHDEIQRFDDNSNNQFLDDFLNKLK